MLERGKGQEAFDVRWIGVLIVNITFLLAVTSFTQAQPFNESPPLGPLGSIIPGRFIVELEEGVLPEDIAGEFASRIDGFVEKRIFSSALKGLAVEIQAESEGELDDKLAIIGADPRIRSIEPDRVVSIPKPVGIAGGAPDPPDKQGDSEEGGGGSPTEVRLTGVDRIDAEINHAKSPPVTGAGINIAIIDTGIDLDHPDLTPISGGIDFVGEGGMPLGDDGNGHGSHVAGTAAARDNTIGVIGVAPGANLWVVKVLNKRGSGFLSDVIAAVDWVAGTRSDPDPNNNIDIANMSLGGVTSTALCDAITTATGAGVTIVVAAGNEGVDASSSSPANCPDAETVSAIADSDGQAGGLGPLTSFGDPDDSFAFFSNFGSAVDIAAPGEDIFSTWKNGSYNTISGTSMAAPHVTGGAALYLEVNPGSLPADIRSGLLSAGFPQHGTEGFSGDPDHTTHPSSLDEPLVNAGGGPPPALASIAVTPTTASIPVGATEQFVATGSFADGSTADLTSSVTWSSSNSAVATMNAAGLATAIAEGTTTITATSGTISNVATLTVTAPPPPPTLNSIAVAPTTPSISAGATQQFVATGTYSDGSTADLTSSVSWNSSNTLVATMNAAGLATAIAEGTTTITATFTDGTFGSTMLTVTAAPAVDVNILVTARNIREGRNYRVKAELFNNDPASSATVTVTCSVTPSLIPESCGSSSVT
ncbi:MAG: S8 family serine peptidase, partial [Nitrospiria bacterium]